MLHVSSFIFTDCQIKTITKKNLLILCTIPSRGLICGGKGPIADSITTRFPIVPMFGPGLCGSQSPAPGRVTLKPGRGLILTGRVGFSLGDNCG